MIEIILAALALAAAGTAAVAWRKRKRRGLEEQAPALMAPRQLEAGELLPNDVIVHLGTDFLVEGVATFSEGGRAVLVLALLNEGGFSKYLLIELEEPPRFVMMEQRDAEPLGRAIPRWVQEESLELQLSRRAAVRVKAVGECGIPEQGACEFGIFHGPGQRKAALFLPGGGDAIFVAGRGVTREGLRLLPGGSVVSEGDESS